MPSLPNEILFLNELSSKEIANELEKLPENASVKRFGDCLYIYFY